MLVKLERDGDRYIARGREGGTGLHSIGFIRHKGKWWDASDIYMDKSRSFRTRIAAVEWLKTLPFPPS